MHLRSQRKCLLLISLVHVVPLDLLIRDNINRVRVLLATILTLDLSLGCKFLVPHGCLILESLMWVLLELLLHSMILLVGSLLHLWSSLLKATG